MKLLVVAAWEPELERLRSFEPVASEINLNIQAVGIGVVDATLGTARAIARYAPEHVILLGTCGASPTSALAIGDVVAASEVRLVDPAVAEERAAMPYASEPLLLDRSMVEALVSSGAHVAKVNTTMAITTEDALAIKLAAFGEVEHLEAYGVARACEAASLACSVVLGVANVVGAKGREQWRAHHVDASACAAEIARLAIKRSTTERSRARSSGRGS